jgi:DNA-binding LacI/PurR family transcriptional regulator
VCSDNPYYIQFGKIMPSNFRRRNQRITIKDVARVSGVSTQTVSRVLNDRPDVSDETRHKVKKIINELDYQPSALARSLIHQRSFTIGVVIYGLKYVGVNLTLAGIIEQAQVFGYNLLIKEIASLAIEDVQPVIRELLASEVEGILYAVQEWGDNWRIIRQQLATPPVPMVFLKYRAQPNFCTISIDNHLGGCMATQHLLDIGRRKIAHISGPEKWQETITRHQGWLDTLHAAGITVENRQVYVGDWTSTSGEEALLELLESFPEMDGIFAANDQMALGVIHLAAKKGIKIPDDIALVGFDDISEAPFFTPSLTTIRQDFDQLGSLAIKKLLQTFEHKPLNPVEYLSDSIVLKPQLIVRESTIGF